jgi:hypothetical protein
MVQVEAPWPADGEKTTATRDGVTVTVEEARKSDTTLLLRVRVDHPESAAPSWNFGPRGGPILLLDAQGKPLPPEGMRFYGGESSSRYRIYHLQYRGAAELPSKVGAAVLKRSGSLTNVPFRLENIPLPDFTMVAGAAPLLPDTGPKPAARLAGRVLVNGQPAGPGTLYFGLRTAPEPGKPEASASAARVSAAGWRWLEAPTGAEGTGRLAGLAPGRYLIRRYWVPAAPGGAMQSPPDPLAWKNALVEVELAAGQEAQLEPLIAGPAGAGAAR